MMRMLGAAAFDYILVLIDFNKKLNGKKRIGLKCIMTGFIEKKGLRFIG
jgi:hypothetical protein